MNKFNGGIFMESITLQQKENSVLSINIPEKNYKCDKCAFIQKCDGHAGICFSMSNPNIYYCWKCLTNFLNKNIGKMEIMDEK